jgi:hypothetical protein
MDSCTGPLCDYCLLIRFFLTYVDLHSKSSPFPAQFDEPGKTFARFSSMVGCPPPSKAAVECLRNAPFRVRTFNSISCQTNDFGKTVLNASNFLVNTVLNSQPWEPTPGGPNSFVPERGSQRIASGNYFRVPLLWGTNVGILIFIFVIQSD